MLPAGLGGASDIVGEVGWQTALDVLADTERRLRLAGLLEDAGAVGDGLRAALEGAAAGTRVEAEMIRISTAIRAGGARDGDVRALRSELVRAVEVRDALMLANAGTAQKLAELAATAGVAAAAESAAVTAARERALGSLTDAVAAAEDLVVRGRDGV